MQRDGPVDTLQIRARSFPRARKTGVSLRAREFFLKMGETWRVRRMCIPSPHPEGLGKLKWQRKGCDQEVMKVGTWVKKPEAIRKAAYHSKEVSGEEE